METKTIAKRIETLTELDERFKQVSANYKDFVCSGLMLDDKNPEVKCIQEACSRLLINGDRTVNIDNVKALRDEGYIIIPAGDVYLDGIHISTTDVGFIRYGGRENPFLLYN